MTFRETIIEAVKTRLGESVNSIDELIKTITDFQAWIDMAAEGSVTWDDNEYKAYLSDIKAIIKDLKRYQDDDNAVKAIKVANEVIKDFTFDLNRVDDMLENGSFPSTTKQLKALINLTK